MKSEWKRMYVKTKDERKNQELKEWCALGAKDTKSSNKQVNTEKMLLAPGLRSRWLYQKTCDETTMQTTH